MSVLQQLSGPSNMPAPDPVVPCCDASLHSDGQSCTCWEAELDVEPTPDVQEGPQLVRRRMCNDCAYRPDSRERKEADGDLPGYTLDQPFQCHTGMPRAVGYRHPSLGDAVVPDVTGSDYRPFVRAQRAWQADGRPAELCAGWAAANRIRRPADRLDEVERAMLAFERLWWQKAGAKEVRIRDEFGMEPTAYYQRLNALVDRPAAMALDPLTCSRLRRIRATRRGRREAGRELAG